MERQTKSIQIGSHTIVVKTYATARETNAIQQTYFKGSKVEVVGNQPKISEFNPAVRQDVEKELINQLVVSIDGKKENAVETALDFEHTDYEALITQLDGLVSKKN